MVFFGCVCLGGYTLDLKRKKKARENKGGLISLLNNINKKVKLWVWS